MKRIKINKMSKREISDSLNEIRFLASIRHKNIVGFYEVSSLILQLCLHVNDTVISEIYVFNNKSDFCRLTFISFKYDFNFLYKITNNIISSISYNL